MIPITNCHGFIVGYVSDEIYYTARAEHFFKIFIGYAISIDVLIKARLAGAEIVKMKSPGGKFILTSIQRWYRDGVEYVDGDDPQRVLSLEQLKDDIYNASPSSL